ncbi:MAG: urea ABC transporter permease subunit UrtB, partial [Janthinobacterium sp.]
MQILPKLLVLACLFLASMAQAAIPADLLKPLAGDDPDARVAAVAQIAALATPEAARVLQALQDDALYAASDGKLYVVDGEQAYDPVLDRSVPLPDGIDGVMVNNRLRAAVAGALSGLQLLAPERGVRLAAAQALQKAVDPVQLPLIRTA